jgi:putative spermidine/putrescine transport system ATP-binding protein
LPDVSATAERSPAGGATAAPAVEIRGAGKRYGEVTALEKLDLKIDQGEFFSLLGPSGSGKTTALRLIAGFETPTTGRVLLLGHDVTDLPPYDRDVNTVFQDYALFPHMTVEANVEYGLMVKKVSARQRRDRVADALRMVRLEAYGKRKPAELSGGQRQRVALARALVNRPGVLLLDEPLGALDLKLRQQMQIELKAIQRDLGLTFIYVTHDQEEALTMSHRLAVLNDGRIEQVGPPADVYERPASRFVAGFVGTSNLVEGEAALKIAGSEEPFTIRPEKMRFLEENDLPAPDDCIVSGRIEEVIYLGSSTRFLISVEGAGDQTLIVNEQNRGLRSPEALDVLGRPVRIAWDRRNNRPV